MKNFERLRNLGKKIVVVFGYKYVIKLNFGIVISGFMENLEVLKILKKIIEFQIVSSDIGVYNIRGFIENMKLLRNLKKIIISVDLWKI